MKRLIFWLWYNYNRLPLYIQRTPDYQSIYLSSFNLIYRISKVAIFVESAAIHLRVMSLLLPIITILALILDLISFFINSLSAYELVYPLYIFLSKASDLSYRPMAAIYF